MEGIPVQNPLSPPNFFNLRNSILLIILALLIILSGVLIFIYLNQGKTPQASKEPTVSLTKDYDNPFDKSTQYVNPFSEYKNPFDELIK